MGTHWEGFSINPREGDFLGANIFPGQMRPLASLLGVEPEKMGYGESEIYREPGLRAPPGGRPRPEGPGATVNRWHIDSRQPAAHRLG